MITLSPSQQEVVDHFPSFLLDEDQDTLTIAGFAGSGKTFLVQYLADINESQQDFLRVMDPEYVEKKIFFTATTNKAADVLSQLINQPTTTIHKVLGLAVVPDNNTGRELLEPTGHGKNLSNSIVFIDEASMINRDLLSYIWKAQAKYDDCKVVFIGDSYQLPPVKEQPPEIFNTLAYGEVMFLREIQRQAAKSPIIQLSAEYRKVLDTGCEWPELETVPGHIVYYGDDKATYLAEIKNKMAFQTGHNPLDYRICAWSNRRVINYNNFVRKTQGLKVCFSPGETVITNKPLFNEKGKAILADTDTVQVIKNIWQATQSGLAGYRIQLYGIDTEFFMPADWNQANRLKNQFAKDARDNGGSWGPYWHAKKHWADLRPSHASTVHKAQGSTFKEVFVDLQDIGRNNHWREVARLVYVAITRASHKVHIYGKLQERYNKDLNHGTPEFTL